jgi:hypothetical protein
MNEQQLDLFSSAGIQAECPLPQSMELHPAPTALGIYILDPRAVADGALWFWQAIEEVGPKTRGQASVACRLQMLGAFFPNSAPSTSWKSPVGAPRR